MSCIPEITFVLPTRNRVAWVGRAIQSCLDLAAPDLDVQVLVVDGGSTDGTRQQIEKTFGNDSRVKAWTQLRPGRFTAACQEGLAKVTTEYASLMFDDDILLANFRLLPGILKKNKSEFGFGFGGLFPLEKRMIAESARGIWWFEPRQLLEFYLGIRRSPGQHGLPESPLVVVASNRLWKLWSVAIESFCEDSAFRRLCMFEKSAGPDFLIYLLACLEAKTPIPVLDGIVAQFSDHTGSLTHELANLELPTGYWLSRVWLFQEAIRRGLPAKDLGLIWAFLMKRGRILWSRWNQQNPSLVRDFQKEWDHVLQSGKKATSAWIRIRSLLRLALPRKIRVVGLGKVRYDPISSL